MIGFGVSVADRQKFRQWAEPGMARVAEPDSEVWTIENADSIQHAYNAILDRAAERDDLEALVLLHEDTEIDDVRFMEKVRNGFHDPLNAVLGPVGARGVRSLAWWEADVTFGRVGAPNVTLEPIMHAEVPYGWHQVDSVDGLMMVLSPWAVREVRFDERFAAYFHGYDVDYCFEVRAQGRRCLVAPLGAIHYGVWRPTRVDRWIEAHVLWQRKWAIGGMLPRPPELAWA